MGEAAKKTRYSIEEYLEIEQNSLERYEYHSGEIFAMAGGTLNHSLLSSNIIRGIGNSLIKNGKPCRIYTSDAKIAVSDEDFVYADAFVVCGKTENYPTNKHAASNPILIVEVLSSSTALYDREEKFQSYRYIKSFREYVLISQDKVIVEVFYKPERVAFWQYRAFNDLNEIIELKSIGVEVSMKDIYLDWEPEK